ncbi:hypothetical protein EII12_09380 [Buchananella hordeovulneris]|uniref:CrcB family protein n=1 Tax=Buchananella hordeovulneris TaxID=52770 RepID=UPI000F602FDB|nr:CrcB family protein [Buchananella hordeovulneris]RRD50504.1 hypothetical protein EII12_09380 [Buchananella hordeovulneris]
MLLAVAGAGAAGAVARWGLEQAVRAGLRRAHRSRRGDGSRRATRAATRLGGAADGRAPLPSAPATQVQPGGTVVVNVVGCLLAGWVAGASLPPALHLLLLTGFLGGFTTFSTAVLDLAQLATRQPGRALAVGGLTLAAAVAAARCGLALAGAAGN